MRSVTLGLECGVGQGSVALLVDGEVIVSTTDGTVAASRAENILGIVKSAVDSSGLDLHAIDRIAVSAGPGSYSGIRIGWATALGLAASISSSWVGVPLLEAIAVSEGLDSPLIVAVPVGKRDIAWREFAGKIEGQVMHGYAHEFAKACADFGGSIVVPERDLRNRLDDVGLRERLEPANEPLAVAVARFAETHLNACVTEPLYIRDQAGRTAS